MHKLDEIPVTVGRPAGPVTNFGTATPLLSEIRHAVARLADGGEPTCIDLAALPFGPDDEAHLMAVLGEGEVRATIDALGATHIRETRFPGVWVVAYHNTDGQRIGLQIEVDAVPGILRTPTADLPDTLAALDACLRADAAPPSTPASQPERAPAPVSHAPAGSCQED